MISAAYHREHGPRLPGAGARLPSEGAAVTRRWPGARWTPDLPRFALLDGPSPLQPIPRFAAAIGGGADIWIKREDLLPLAFGGNKLRNLEFLVGAALAEGADTLVTTGRRWSNHARLTAAAGAKAGLGVHLVLSGPPLDRPGPNQRLDELLGAVVHVTATESREDRATTVDLIMAELRAAGHRPYLVPTGGSGPVGVVGSILAGLELADQAAAQALHPDVVVLPTATGGTQAGLLVGLARAGLRARVVGVAVAHPPEELIDPVATLLAVGTELVGIDRALVGPVEIVGDQLGEAYGRPTAASEKAARLLARSEGILVDPVYTAKALAGLVAMARTDELEGRTVVFWHAGGTPGLFEQLDEPTAD
jgi:1-aminocyclopropane-1-carboxylate deaminase/D-cysteine desulfhydrase-like pyridoxal-dependent ACC family enzyme